MGDTRGKNGRWVRSVYGEGGEVQGGDMGVGTGKEGCLSLVSSPVRGGGVGGYDRKEGCKTTGSGEPAVHRTWCSERGARGGWVRDQSQGLQVGHKGREGCMQMCNLGVEGAEVAAFSFT